MPTWSRYSLLWLSANRCTTTIVWRGLDLLLKCNWMKGSILSSKAWLCLKIQKWFRLLLWGRLWKWSKSTSKPWLGNSITSFLVNCKYLILLTEKLRLKQIPMMIVMSMMGQIIKLLRLISLKKSCLKVNRFLLKIWR